MSAGDEPTDVMSGDDDEPTRRLDPETDPLEGETERLEGETGQTEEMRTRRLASEGPEQPPTGPPPSATESGDDSRGRGLRMLAGSVAAALILVGIYIAAGGLDYKPAGAANPCDARVWTDPGNFEESAQQFTLSAIDGAACDLGVSREELTRALADDDARNQFAEDQGLSEGEIEDAFRSGLNRAIDDAEDAGVISGLAVTGLRAAVRVMPLDQMLLLIDNASEIFSSGQINDFGDLINGVVGSLGGDSTDSGDDSGATGESGDTDSSGDTGSAITDGLDQIEQDLRDQLPDSVEKNVPDDIQKQIEDQLNNLLSP